MIRRSVAGAILGVSLLIGSFAWTGFVASRTVFDPDRSRVVAAELLDNDQVRAQVEENLALALRNIVPDQVPVSDELINDVTAELMANPAVEATILNAFAATHAAFLGEGDAPQSIDLTPVVQVARDSLVAAAPELDGVVNESPDLLVALPTEHIPNAGPVRRFVRAAVPILAALAIAGALLALLTTNHRPAILRRAGFWALTTTAIYLLIGLGVPWLLREYAPEQAEVIAALLAALLRSIIIPSIALAVAGVASLVVSALWRSFAARDRTPRRVEPERPPYADAPHRMRVAAMDRPAGQGAATPAPAAPRTPARAAPSRPAAAPVPVGQPPVAPRAAGPAARPAPLPHERRPAPAPPRPAPAPDARPVGSVGAPPAPGAAPVGSTPSPYPDEQHHRLAHLGDEQYRSLHPPAAGAAPTPGAPTGRPPPAGTPAAAPPAPDRSPHSIFDDVPTPTPSVPSAPPVAATTPADVTPSDPANHRSVFDTPDATGGAASVAPNPAVSSAPPPGARFSPDHGWILDPESSTPLPAGAVWVDGVGYVLRSLPGS